MKNFSLFFILLVSSLAGLSSFAQNISGTITCNGIGVPNVVVSDGYIVTTTDIDGKYAFTSDKKNGYVFYSLPSGYEPVVTYDMDTYRKIIPPFWETLTSKKTSVSETHNFKLKQVDNTKHIMIVGTDIHLSNRTNDENQFIQGFLSRIREEKTAAGTTPIYSTFLGDLAWDGYWYSNNYDLRSFRATLTNNNYPLKLFPIMGNHDNDGATPATDSTDFVASGPFRTIMAPNYYSYNIGKIHYIVLDDIYYKNTDTGESYNTGIVGSRDYDNYIPDYEIDWLKKDLAYISTSTPIIVELHIPVWRIRTYSPFVTYAALTNHNSINSSVILCDVLKDYQKVHILTGHTHYNYHAFPSAYPNIHENNIAAVCATWWWTGYLTGRHLCTDGSPGGYEVYYMDSDSISWQYHSIEKNGNAQFRVFDTNSIIDYYKNNSTIQAILAKYSSRQKYDSYYTNSLLINIFNYDPSWKIEATENGVSLTATRVLAEDPLHTLAYDVPRFAAVGSYTDDFSTHYTSHMFLIRSSTATGTINLKVTDRFGNIFEKTVTRPIDYNINMTDQNDINWLKIQEQTADNARIYSEGNTLCIDSKSAAKATIISINGMYKTVNINAGHNEFSGQQRGIYIVKTNGITQKIFIH